VFDAAATIILMKLRKNVYALRTNVILLISRGVLLFDESFEFVLFLL